MGRVDTRFFLFFSSLRNARNTQSKRGNGIHPFFKIISFVHTRYRVVELCRTYCEAKNIAHGLIIIYIN